MKRTIWLVVGLLVFSGALAFAAYHHEGEKDAGNFTAVYPQKAGTKLDHCALCHTGGTYEQKPGQWVTLGSCQWCHYTYGYDGHGNILDTMNPYGKDYHYYGRNQAAITSIEGLDSDGDGYTNIQEINASRYPGDPNDDPSKVVAPYRVYSKAQFEAMPKHTQFLLMNTSRSGDFYAEYTGVVLSDLLVNAGMHSTATGITVYAPDGWSQYHPLDLDPAPEMYHVRGVYPESAYYYNAQADVALTPTDGWCDYSAPSCSGRQHLDPIVVPGGLKTIFAYKREGAYLQPGVLNVDNKLDGEGPFRVVPPQKVPSPPDQSSKAKNQDVIWPYTEDWDHNAGASTRTVTTIRVNPLPPGTTDIDLLEAGWRYVDEEKVIIYGAIEPGRDEVVVDFGSHGLWHYAGQWNSPTSWDPQAMASWFGGVSAGFGGDKGLWNYNGSMWSQICGWDPQIMTGWFRGLATGFGSGRGLWNYDGGQWTQLSSWKDPVVMTGWSKGLAVGFGGNTGLWSYDGSQWSQLSSWKDPVVMTGWSKGLAVGFGGNTGLWSYDGSQWSQLSSWKDPVVMTGWSKGLAVGFGGNTGLWSYDGTSWLSIAGWDAVSIGVWDGGLVAGFGSGKGVWTYDGTTWTHFAGWDAQGVCGANLKVD